MLLARWLEAFFRLLSYPHFISTAFAACHFSHLFTLIFSSRDVRLFVVFLLFIFSGVMGAFKFQASMVWLASVLYMFQVEIF